MIKIDRCCKPLLYLLVWLLQEQKEKQIKIISKPILAFEFISLKYITPKSLKQRFLNSYFRKDRN